MLIFDQLRKSDPQLRMLAVALLSGMAILVAGLWWVQIVSTRDYRAHLEMQAFRTVRIPAVRGRILDRNGVSLAENRPTYNINLYLDELRKRFDAEYTAKVARARGERAQGMTDKQAALGRKLKKEEKKAFILTASDRAALKQDARYEVASNVVYQISRRLHLPEPTILDRTNFQRHYETRLALPCTVFSNITPGQVALFYEQSSAEMGVDVEVQSTRLYPFQATGAHVLGFVQRDDSSVYGEESFFSYRLQGYRGKLGVEAAFDDYLRGRAGMKSFQVNNVGYRQTENVWTPAEPGTNIILTIDFKLQQAVEHAMRTAGPFGPATQGAAVVLDVNSGDILSLSSVPGYNPNFYIQGFPPGEAQKLQDARLKPQRNRATQDIYEPGSIFKTIIGLAALEAGLNPLAMYNVARNPSHPDKGVIYVGKRPWKDLAAPGDYDFKKALKRSSNSYFITNGLYLAGMERIVALAQRLHLGESCGLNTHQDSSGIFPTPERIRSRWYDGDTANICIGQGQMAVTPLQMAVMTAAIANGGKVLWPRLVDRLMPQDAVAGEQPIVLPSARVRDDLGVKESSLRVVREAMLADVEDADGTGRNAAVPGMKVCGKTGTAQVSNTHNEIVDHTTWFISFAPFDKPRYAVVVMVEGGSSGGGDCAPIAGAIYRAILERERTAPAKPDSLAKAR